MAETTQAATTESAASEFGLADEIGEMFGEVSLTDAETPGTEAGTTPAAETATAGAAAEGADKEVRAETPSADATKTDPDKKDTETPTSEADPLEGAKPFTYTSPTGEEKSIEGIRVLAEHGAIVTPEGLAQLSERLADAERFHATTREQYAQIQNFEKLSEWKTTGEDGKEINLSGTEGLLAARVQLATLAAAYGTLAESLRDPKAVAALLAQNEKGDLVLNEQGLQALILRSENAEMKASQAARAHFGNVIKQETTARSGSQSQVDFAAEAPKMIDRIAGADAKLLNDADKKFLSEQFPRYVRAVTENDRRHDVNLKIGSPIVDASFAAVVKDRANMRSEIAKTVKANSSAADENARRLAAAAAGTRTKQVPTTEARKDESTRESDADKAWRERERALAASIR